MKHLGWASVAWAKRARLNCSGWGCIGVWILALLPLDARPVWNNKDVPRNKEDLVEIQESLKACLERAKEATVCIELEEEQGSGSGVIVSPQGLVMTAAHVITGVGVSLNVKLEDGTTYSAISLGLDSTSDAALLQIISEEEFVYVEKELSESTQVGDWVFSLGHSGGFDLARGSVVRLGRVVRSSAETLQTDCKLIGGDSGGPLFNLSGELVGIHSRVGSQLEGNMHVPLQEYELHWEALKKSEFLGDGVYAKRPQVGTGFLGIGVEQVAEGLKIIEFSEDSKAKSNGVEQGDVLTSVDGHAMETESKLSVLMQTKAKNDPVVLELTRQGENLTIKLRLGER